jgi:uncharacterized tellurite resistance protein B-like protein
MGLFDMFKSDNGETMTPHLGFAISLLYMMGADGDYDNEEIGHLLSVLGGESSGNTVSVGANNRALLDKAINYVKRNTVEHFLNEINPLLSDAQKMAVLLNLLDSSLSDGTPEPEEQQMFSKFLVKFGIGEDRFKPFFQVIALKHDRTVFTDKNHLMNREGYKVSLGI